MSNDKLRPETIAAQALHAVDKATGAVVPPINLATTFARDENYELREGNVYQRDGHPLLLQAEGTINALEQGQGTLLFASGMAACSALFETIPHGAHVVAQDVMYHGVASRLAEAGRSWPHPADTVQCERPSAAFGSPQLRQDRSCLDRDAKQPDLGWLPALRNRPALRTRQERN